MVTRSRIAVPSKSWKRFSTSSSIKTPEEKKFLTNRGVIEGVWIFCRHGDRAPSRPLCPSHKIAEEAGWWESRLPCPNTLEAYQELSRYFPPDIHTSNDGQFLDVRRSPFGFLTQAGIKQTRENGIRLFNRYNRLGHHLPNAKEFFSANDFLECWDIKVYSTNYLRTIMSVQSLLDGLLGTKCYEALQQQTEKKRDERNGTDIPNHQTIKNFSSDALLPVQVRGRSEDTLNAFDRNPDLMAELVGDVISSADFQETDGAAAPLAARLANILPGLFRKKKNTSGFNAAPSGINWIEATDHFVCRTSHNISFSRFSSFEHDDRIEQTLSALSHQTKAHLAWRFRQWYKSPRLLAAIAAPPLREIADQLLHATKLGARERRPFTIYSCHDVTILALLYGIGADFLAGDDRALWRNFWPEYSSMLVFELVRINEKNSEQSHVLRVLLNGKPVRSVDQHEFYWEGPFRPVGQGPLEMLLTCDFDNIVSRLEQAGGYSRGSLKADDTDSKRDLSNWTG